MSPNWYKWINERINMWMNGREGIVLFFAIDYQQINVEEMKRLENHYVLVIILT